MQYFFLIIFCEYFKKNGGGKIVNIGSIYGCVGPDFNIYKNESFELEPDYVFIKFGMVGITKFLLQSMASSMCSLTLSRLEDFKINKVRDLLKKYSKKPYLIEWQIMKKF